MNNIELQIEYLDNFPAGKNLINKDNPFLLNLIYASKEETNLFPFQRESFKTGIKIKFPEYCYGHLTSHAEKFLKKGVAIIIPGIFTSDYDKEIEVILFNMDYDIFTLKPYVKIGELLINHGCKLNFNLNPKRKTYNKRTINYLEESDDDGFRWDQYPKRFS